MADEGRRSPADPAAVADENRRMRVLRVLVDTAVAVLRQRPLSAAEVDQLIEHVRAQALALFPDKGGVFDLIYGSRLRRVARERGAMRDTR